MQINGSQSHFQWAASDAAAHSIHQHLLSSCCIFPFLFAGDLNQGNNNT